MGGRDRRAGPLDPLLLAQGVEPGKGRVRSLVERELQGGLQLGLRRPGPGTEGVLRFKRWRPGRQAHGVPELQEQGWPAKLPLQHRGDPGPRRPPCPVAEARRHPDQGAQRALSDQVVAGMARVLSATVKEEAGRWSVSFGCALERHDPVATYPEAIVGVDLWLHHFAVLSTGELFENPRPISQRARRMARLNRELSRRQKGSKRRARTRAKLTRCHARVANLRRDTLHKLTTQLATAYGTVVIEDLAVKNMTACPRPKADPENPGHHLLNGHAAKAGLNRSILDASPGELRRQLSYKMSWHGGHLVVADRWFPSSKKCSSCKKAKATLSLGRGPTAASIVVWSSTGTTTQHATLPPTATSTSSPGVARRLKTDAEAMLGVPATPVHTPRKALVAGSLKTAPGNRRRPSPPLRKGRRRECACNYCTLDRNGTVGSWLGTGVARSRAPHPVSLSCSTRSTAEPPRKPNSRCAQRR